MHLMVHPEPMTAGIHADCRQHHSCTGGQAAVECKIIKIKKKLQVN